MGKSPGKWIKTVLFGKKSSKSSFAKNAAIEKKAPFDHHVPSDPPPQTTYISDGNTELERGICANLSCDAVLLPEMQGSDAEGTVELNSANNAEAIRQHQAATKAQAAFRGYLARRAFRALKGIIRLQAVIRGHLVRRQAVATWRCMQAIVKFQALARGRKVRLSDAGIEVLKKCRLGESMHKRERTDIIAVNMFSMSEKLSRNALIIKLVASLPTVTPLSLQYGRVEPNSVWNWLERWSSSRSWEPLARPKKSLKSKHLKRKTNKQTSEREPGRPKKGVQRVPPLNSDGKLLHSSSEYDKPKRNQRKAPSHQTELGREHPQSELENGKHNLRKISASAEDVSDKTESVTGKPQCSLKEDSSSPAPDVYEQGMDNSSEKTNDPTVAVPEHPVVEVEPLPKALAADESVEMLHDDDDNAAAELVFSESGEKVMNSDKTNEELSSKEDQTKENQRTQRRRSFPAKQEYPENVSQSTPTLPSYMQVTKSAKAKVRAQGSPGFSEDGAESGFDRRRSLASSTNGKVISLSPRVQRPRQANSKGSLLCSRDEKVLQPGWRR